MRYGGKVYYFSGVGFKDGRFTDHLASVLSYDLAARTWSVEGSILGRSSFAAAALGPELFMSGGAMNGEQLTNRNLAWNVQTKTVRELAPLPEPRYQHAAAEINGRIYIAGGGSSVHSALEPSHAVWEYDPRTDQWTRKADMPIPMRNLCLVAYLGKLYAIGGHNVGPENRGNIVQEYDPVKNTWRRRADMPTPRTDIAAVPHAGRIYVLGGFRSLDVVESFDPATNNWRTEPELKEGRFAPATVVVDGKFLVLGGLPNNTVQYKPAPH